MSLKLWYSYPDRITLLRGNHECREITRIYGFYAEIIQKYDSTEPWVWCTDVFDYLGIAALVDNRVLCIHGGLSPDIATIDQIRTLNRLQEVPPTGCYSDLLWSDPDNVDGFQQSPRGAGYLFGEDPVNVFNEVNGLELICRAHQMVQQGFEYMFSKKNLITVWSAPNYCYRCDNVASILQLDEGLNRTMLIFKENKEKQQKESQSGSSFPFFSF
ncbi:phytochrome-associated serine threonine protein phosphatase [Blastocystis sp. subtype 4]|uniref:phytochrome-associated serine threonine protein phosphatase n=1 Tax=Blastocystis sp. subtype 4 TaxID=944170 RepID=UPI0007120925|nr:phytochrome-associated serine threonine protein phosphatase [Blastocystis sp. subtype 4]KNB45025.1 phytochrome-associated serine threonine protein phosphatase [Blastocystis sp. subtype 4]|eukprot:XP_014528468.1 phytochrome-associated serine threonine protein phosphatase [Blastocystis sp. subtype 4]